MKHCPAFASLVLLVLLFTTGPTYSATREHKPAQPQKHHKELSLKHRSPIHSSRTVQNLKTHAIKYRPLAKDGPRKLETSKRPARVTERAVAARTHGHAWPGAESNVNSQKLAWTFTVRKEEVRDPDKRERGRLTPGSAPKFEEDPEKTPIALDDRPRRPWKNEDERQILTRVARSFVGAPYKYGGDSVRGLDCSAFVRKMYAIFEVNLPRCAREQYDAGTRVDRNNLTSGDLVFFRAKPAARYPTHVGIYLGGDMFIHASSLPSRGVRIDHLSGAYFKRSYMGAVRVKAPPAKEAGGR